LITQTKIFTNLKSLIKNNLKRKQKRLTNESRLLNIVVTLKNTIINYLIKKLKLDLILTILILSSFENLTNEANISQASQRIQKDFKDKL